MRQVEGHVTRERTRRHSGGVGISIEEAFAKFGPDLLRHASTLVGPDHAPDIVSEAIIGAMRSKRWPTHDHQLPYLHRSVLNAARMWHRSRLRTERREWSASVPASSSYELLTRPDVVAAIRQLSVRQRSVVYFTYWEDLTAGQVADVLDISEGTVKRHLARARDNLRSVLDA